MRPKQPYIKAKKSSPPTSQPHSSKTMTTGKSRRGAKGIVMGARGVMASGEDKRFIARMKRKR